MSNLQHTPNIPCVKQNNNPSCSSWLVCDIKKTRPSPKARVPAADRVSENETASYSPHFNSPSISPSLLSSRAFWCIHENVAWLAHVANDHHHASQSMFTGLQTIFAGQSAVSNCSRFLTRCLFHTPTVQTLKNAQS